jgi:hypothetical protein
VPPRVIVPLVPGKKDVAVICARGVNDNLLPVAIFLKIMSLGEFNTMGADVDAVK